MLISRVCVIVKVVKTKADSCCLWLWSITVVLVLDRDQKKAKCFRRLVATEASWEQTSKSHTVPSVFYFLLNIHFWHFSFTGQTAQSRETGSMEREGARLGITCSIPTGDVVLKWRTLNDFSQLKLSFLVFMKKCSYWSNFNIFTFINRPLDDLVIIVFPLL